MILRSLLLWLLAVGSSWAADLPRVVTANTLLWDLTQQVGGDAIHCSSLVPVGVDPHGFQPAPSAVREITEASLVIVNGLGLDPWVERLIKNSGYRGPVLVASAGVAPLTCSDHGHDHDHDHGEVDPHAWHDLRRAALYVQNIRDALIQIAPDQAVHIRQRAATYLASIQTLDTEARARISRVPAANRRLVTSHDALAYLGEAYGLEIIPISGLRPDREPSAREMAALVRRIRTENVRAVFIEATSNPKIPRLLAQETGVKVVTELYTDSLGLKGSPGATFLGMFRHNLDTLVLSLSP